MAEDALQLRLEGIFVPFGEKGGDRLRGEKSLKRVWAEQKMEKSQLTK